MKHVKTVMLAIPLLPRVSEMAELPVPPVKSSSCSPLFAKDSSLSCVSCGENVEELKCLPCLHSLALCSKEDCQQKALRRKVSCEICKEVYSVPPEGLSDHPFALRMALSNQHKKEGILCEEMHKEERSAVSFCSECDEFICQECVDHHKKFRALMKHTPKSLKDVFNEGGTGRKDFLKCEKHGETCKLFCHSCSEVICHICSSIEPHRSHSVSYIDKQLGDCNKAAYTQCLSSMKAQIKFTDKVLREVQAKKASLQQQSTAAMKEVATFRKYMFAVVKAKCDSIVAEVKETEDKGIRFLDEHERVLVTKLKKMQEFSHLSEQVSTKGTIEERLALTKLVISRTGSMCTSSSSLQSSSVIAPSVEVVRFSKDEIVKHLSPLVTVHHNAHPPNCVISDMKMSISCLEEEGRLSLVVTTRDKNGTVCRGGEKVLAILRPVTAGVALLGEVSDKRDGTYEVQFKSIPAEMYLLSVTISGHHIAGSPVDCNGLKEDMTVKDGVNESQLRVLDSSATIDTVPYVKRIARPAYPGKTIMRGVDIHNNTIEYRSWARRKPLTFQVITRDDKGEQCEGRESVAAVLTGLKSSTVLEGQVTGKGDGTYYVHFKQILSEDSCLSVTVKGQDIVGSPLEVKHVGFNVVISPLLEPTASIQGGQCFLLVDKKIIVMNGDEMNILDKQSGTLQSSKKLQSSPRGSMAISKGGHLLTCAHDSNSIYVYSLAGEFIGSFGEKGSKPGQLDKPMGLAVNKEGQLFVVECNNHRVSVFSENYEFLYSFGSFMTGLGQLQSPQDLCIAPDGLVYVTGQNAFNSNDNSCIQVFHQNGKFVRSLGEYLNNPNSIAATSDGHIVVACTLCFSFIEIFTSDGKKVHNATLFNKKISNIAVDDEGLIYVADVDNKKILTI